MNMLEISVVDGESGPVVFLSGEADLTTLDELNSVLDRQIWAGVRLLTVDLSQLRFADSATIAALLLSARSARDQGGRLEVRNPQQAVVRVMELMGVDQALAVRDDS